MAIAFDAASASGEKTASPFSWNHTCSGANLALFVGISIRDAAAPTVTGITYNGVALTKLRADAAATRAQTELWYLVNPATGTNAISCTLTAAPGDACGGAVSFTGVDQTTPNDVAGGAGATDSSGSSTNATQSITTITDNAWTFAVVAFQFNVTLTIGAGQTQRWNTTMTSANGQGAGGTSDVAVTPAGSKTMNWTGTGGGNWAISLAAVRPVGGAVGLPFVMQLGAQRI